MSLTKQVKALHEEIDTVVRKALQSAGESIGLQGVVAGAKLSQDVISIHTNLNGLISRFISSDAIAAAGVQNQPRFRCTKCFEYGGIVNGLCEKCEVIAKTTKAALLKLEQPGEDVVITPIQMIMSCPMCDQRHIDKLEFNAHHTHACQYCGHCWRPAVPHTRGVQFLPGFKD